MAKTLASNSDGNNINFEEFWEGVQLPLATAVTPAPDVNSATKKTKFSLGSKVLIRLFDVMNFVFWVYLFIKIFIFDIDRWLLIRINPNFEYLLNYRIILYLALVLILAILWKRFWLVYINFILFPLKLFVWFPAKFIYKRKSWILFITALNSIFNGFRYIRYHVLTKTLFVLAAILISVSQNNVVIGTSIVVMLFVIVIMVYKAMVRFATGSYFLFSQKKLIDKIINSKFIVGLGVENKYKGKKARDLTPDIQNTLVSSLQMSIAFNRLTYLWASQLEKYRNSFQSQLTIYLPYIGLFIGTALSYSFVNYGLYKIDAMNFIAHQGLTWIHFLYYSLVSFYFGEIAAVAPISSPAVAIKILMGTTGVILLGGFFLGMLLAWRKQKDQNDFTEQVDMLYRQAKSIEQKLGTEFGVKSLQDAVIILARVANVGMIQLLDKVLPIELRLFDSGLESKIDGQKVAKPKNNNPNV